MSLQNNFAQELHSHMNSLQKRVCDQIVRELLSAINCAKSELLYEDKLANLTELIECSTNQLKDPNLDKDLFDKLEELRQVKLLQKQLEDAKKQAFPDERSQLSRFDKCYSTVTKALATWEKQYTQGIGAHIRAEGREDESDRKSIFSYRGISIYASNEYSHIQVAEGCSIKEVPSEFLMINEKKVVEYLENGGDAIKALSWKKTEIFSNKVFK